MARRVPLNQMADIVGAIDDPLLDIGGEGEDEVIPMVGVGGNWLGANGEEAAEVLEQAQKACIKIAREIEVLFDFQYVRIGEVPIAFPVPGPDFVWNWAKNWAFYELRWKTLKIKCNRKFVTEITTNPMTLYLVHLFWYAKLQGRCHLSGSLYTIWPRHEDCVSFGKRRHWEGMSSGWSLQYPISLADFNVRSCNIIPEVWKSNSFRGYWKVEYVRKAVKLFITSMRTVAGSLVTSYTGLYIEDGITPIPAGQNLARAVTPVIQIPEDPESSPGFQHLSPAGNNPIIEISDSEDVVNTAIQERTKELQDLSAALFPDESINPIEDTDIPRFLIPANEESLNRVARFFVEKTKPLELAPVESSIYDQASNFFSCDPARKETLHLFAGLIQAIKQPRNEEWYNKIDDDDDEDALYA